MKDNEFEKLIESTLDEYGGQYFDIPADTGHKFSPEFDRRIREITKPKKKKSGAKILRIVTTIGAVAAVAVIGVFAAGPVMNIISNMNNSSGTSISSADKNTVIPGYASSEEGSSYERENDRPYGNNAGEPAQENEHLNILPDEPTETPKEEATDSTNNYSGSDIKSIDSATSYSNCTVTARSGGKNISLSQSDTDRNISAAYRIISDDTLSTDQAFSQEKLEQIRNSGTFILLSCSNGENMVINGNTTPYSSISLYIEDNGNGYAVAEGENAYNCYIFDAYDIFDHLTGE